jgi:hypothetical protein
MKTLPDLPSRRMSTAPHSIDDKRGLLQPPQFRLRTLMIVTAACCGLFALFSVVSALLSAFIVLFLLLIAAHVIGNALGTRLRDGAPTAPIGAFDAPTARQLEGQIACPQRLRETTRIERRTFVLTSCGALTGGLLGGIVLSVVNWAHISVAAGILATVSSAVLGGLATFLAACFITTIRSAWREALSER